MAKKVFNNFSTQRKEQAKATRKVKAARVARVVKVAKVVKVVKVVKAVKAVRVLKGTPSRLLAFSPSPLLPFSPSRPSRPLAITSFATPPDLPFPALLFFLKIFGTLFCIIPILFYIFAS